MSRAPRPPSTSKKKKKPKRVRPAAPSPRARPAPEEPEADAPEEPEADAPEEPPQRTEAERAMGVLCGLITVQTMHAWAVSRGGSGVSPELAPLLYEAGRDAGHTLPGLGPWGRLMAVSTVVGVASAVSRPPDTEPTSAQALYEALAPLVARDREPAA